MTHIKNRLYIIIAAIISLFSLSAVASEELEPVSIHFTLQDPVHSNYLSDHKPVYDPLEPMNRKIYSFNVQLSRIVIIPSAKIYNKFIPEYGKDRIDSFISNLSSPVYFANHLLQGDVNASFTNFWRFMINTTIGIGGLFDMASTMGLKDKKTDFGMTLAKYRIKPGPYLVLPILGPSSFRDFAGNIVDYSIDPFNHKIAGYKIKNDEKIARSSTGYVSSFSKYLDLIEDTENTSLDPYATFKSLYSQTRETK